MAKNKAPKQRPTEPKAAGRWPFPYWLRLTLSLWLVWHVFVVFMAPLSLQPKWSQLSRVTAQSRYIRWYSDPLYLNGGYSFFSPDPPMGGRLIRYKVLGESDEPIVEGEFPNRNNPSYATQWPRLWYHRHMMLVDQSADIPVYQPDGPTPEAAMQAERRNQELSLRAYARHLLRKHGGNRAELELVFHASLEPEQVQAGVEPTDPSLYRPVMSIVETSDQLTEPLLPARQEAELLPMRTAG